MIYSENNSFPHEFSSLILKSKNENPIPSVDIPYMRMIVIKKHMSSRRK